MNIEQEPSPKTIQMLIKKFAIDRPASIYYSNDNRYYIHCRKEIELMHDVVLYLAKKEEEVGFTIAYKGVDRYELSVALNKRLGTISFCCFKITPLFINIYNNRPLLTGRNTPRLFFRINKLGLLAAEEIKKQRELNKQKNEL